MDYSSSFNGNFPAAESSSPSLSWIRECLAFGNTPEAVAQDTVHTLQQEQIGAYLKLSQELFDAELYGIAAVVLGDALRRWPGQAQTCYQLGNCLRMLGQRRAAEGLFRTALEAVPDHREATLSLAHLLRDSGNLQAAAQLVYQFGMQYPQGLDFDLGCIDFLRDCRCYDLASRYCEQLLSSGASDPRLLLKAGRTAHVLGDFATARRHLLAASRQELDAESLGALPLLLANAQRYSDPQHPDLELFRKLWNAAELPDDARSGAGFALGKAFDDLRQYGEASTVLRQSNALAAQRRSWSAQDWQGFVDVQTRAPRSLLARTPARGETVPVFIVGLPRSGTTLAAELLGRHPDLRNRGELNWIQFLHERLTAEQIPHNREGLDTAAAVYLRQANGGDTAPLFFVDKNPLNFRYLGLVAALFPQARIVHCVRNRRDTALSIWSQLFAHDDNHYSHSFAGIAAFAAGHDRLMQHWTQVLPLPVFTLPYEALVQQPEQELDELQRFVGLRPQDLLRAAARTDDAITTASVWQARQPIYRTSENRWRAYAPYLPELMQQFADA